MRRSRRPQPAPTSGQSSGRTPRGAGARPVRGLVARRALITLAEAATAGLTSREMLELVVAAAAALAGQATVHLWLAEEQGPELRLVAESGGRLGKTRESFAPVLKLSEELASRIADSRAPLVVPSLRADRRLAIPAWTGEPRFVSFAGVPFARADRLLGVLCVFTWRRRRFTRHDVDLLRSFASHAAVALESAALFEASGSRLRRLETLREIEREILQQRDADALFGLIVRRAAELLAADAASLFLLDEGGGTLRAHASFNEPEWARGFVLSLGEGVAGRVARERKGRVVNDYPRSPDAIEPYRNFDAALLAQPLLAGAAVRGVLIVRRRSADRPFRDDDLVHLGDFAVQASIALENVRLLRLAAARAERVKAAAEVGQLLASTLDADRIFDLIAEKCREILDARAFGLFRFDDTGRLRYARGFGLDPEFMEKHTLALGEGVVGKAALERRSTQTMDLLGDSAITLSAPARARIAREGSRALVGVPILFGAEVLGVLAVYHAPGYRIPDEETEFLETLANQAAVALENARLFGEARRRQQTAQTLAALTQTLTGSLDLATVLSLVADGMRRLLGSDGGAVGLLEPDGAIHLTVAVGLGADAFRGIVVRRGQGLGGRVLETGQPLWTANYLEDPRISADFADRVRVSGLVAELGVPVKIRDELVGVLWAMYGRSPEVSDEDVALAGDLAQVAAVAVENARLYAAAQRHEAEAIALAEASRRAYQDLKTAQEHLVQTERLRALGEMASGVAHDFNNILAAILGRVQLLLNQVQEPALRRWLQVVERAALDGAQTVRQIQEFTRIRRDQPAETVDLNQVVRDAVEMTQTRWRDELQSQGLEIRVRLDLAPAAAVEGHAAELRQVLTNLILNAVDALPRGGTLAITSRAAGDAVEVAVADDGVGMSDEVRRRIFEPFFTTKGPKGTGLGLAMVYGIVSRHGGSVAVESSDGGGATFTIRLPVAFGGAAAGRVTPHAGDGRPARVLVVDDEEPVRDALADILRLDRHQVVAVSQGSEALEQFRAAPFDVVVTDLAMPGMSGWQVAQAVKASRPDVPLVLVTGWGVELPPEQLRANGVDRVMAKPFRIEEVQRVVAGLLARPAARA